MLVFLVFMLLMFVLFVVLVFLVLSPVLIMGVALVMMYLGGASWNTIC